MTQDNILADKSISYAIRTAKCYKYLRDEKKEDILSKQMYRSGTSIGANVHEAIQAQSRADFISKLGIALKEASETSYWLIVLYRAHILEDNIYKSMRDDCDELIRLLIASIKTTKQNG